MRENPSSANDPQTSTQAGRASAQGLSGSVEASGRVLVRAILFSDPVSWTADFWERHPWISRTYVQTIPDEAPLSSKPFAVLDVPLDATLGEVLTASCEAWGIRPGSDHPYPDGPLHAFAHWIAFADDEDEVRPDRAKNWVHTLAIARPDGTVEQLEWSGVTYRQLVVSAETGVLNADVTRPYIRLAIPQGDANLVVEGARATADAIHAAYAALPQARDAVEEGIRVISATARPARQAIDDVVRVAFLLELARRVRRRLRRSRDD